MDLFLVRGMKKKEKRTPKKETRVLQRKTPLVPRRPSSNGKAWNVSTVLTTFLL